MEVWHCERPGEASVAVKGPELEESCREVEVWLHEHSPGEGICSGRPQHFGDASTMDDQDQQRWWSRAHPSLEDKLGVLQRVEQERPLEEPRRSWVHPGCRTLSSLPCWSFWFFFVQIVVTVPWFLSSVINLLLILQELSWETLNFFFLKGFWSFTGLYIREIDIFKESTFKVFWICKAVGLFKFIKCLLWCLVTYCVILGMSKKRKVMA